MIAAARFSELASRGQISLVVPAFSLAEPHVALSGRKVYFNSQICRQGRLRLSKDRMEVTKKMKRIPKRLCDLEETERKTTWQP